MSDCGNVGWFGCWWFGIELSGMRLWLSNQIGLFRGWWSCLTIVYILGGVLLAKNSARCEYFVVA